MDHHSTRDSRENRSPDRPRQTSPYDIVRRTYNNPTDQHANMGDSSAARPLDQAGNNDQEQELSELNIDMLLKHMKKMSYNIYNERSNVIKIQDNRPLSKPLLQVIDSSNEIEA